MKRRNLAALFAIFLAAFFSIPVLASNGDEEDTDTRFIDARVVEVSEQRISIIARSGVEHVIAIDSTDTKVQLKGKLIALKELREGDIVTVELDELNPLKFARNINVGVQANSEVAKSKP